MKKLLTLFFLCFSSVIFAQEDLSVLRFDEYLAFVKKYHPIAKQAQLVISESEAKLLKARGAFDPKLALDYNRKKFKGTAYYDKLNTSFKIPTWYGVELKANFEEADGVYLNQESTLPQDGLYSAGISFSVAQGLLINKRMASLKQAKLFKQQAKADRDIIVNNILYQASLVYFNWLKAFNEVNLYQEFLTNAQVRFNGVQQNVEVGESAAIDAVEARIVVNERALLHEKAKVKFMKATLELSNYLWLENNIPVELQENMIPNVYSEESIDESLHITTLEIFNFDIEAHPKLQSLSYKYESLKIEKRLKANMLLPKIDLQYNFLSQTPEATNSFNTANYKSGVSILFPLFLRKERGDLKLAKLKLQNTTLDISLSKLSIKNKVDAIKNELQSYVIQNDLTAKMIQDYEQMVSAEERKFTLGESSLFLVNSRERKLMEARLKAILLENSYFETKAKLFNNLAVGI
ncbi:TolC family protein [Lacinutrix sp. C3R15]|uniref:TolC family protein n=1 Tax=Flavobacteriaceae TaxID=49546 RepID=UPI001C09A1F1|nr:MULTISPECIES: TolC family protein [Flavobacteriaceae]MBU2939353.1 TolC family protein [Lacinutrix sp. C3R15]MDO6622668.1 TolC family protein [Oceanihabitans sp. 1_MG-2023]